MEFSIIVLFGEGVVQAYMLGGAKEVNKYTTENSDYAIVRRGFKTANEKAAYVSGLYDMASDGGACSEAPGFCIVDPKDDAVLDI